MAAIVGPVIERLFMFESNDPGGSMILEVTHIYTERLQQVVVPMVAQQTSGLISWRRMVKVKCVAGQQIAMENLIR